MNIRHTYLSTESLIRDASQLDIVEKLSNLQQSLYATENLYNQIIRQIGFPKKQLPIKGIYLWGNVGRGKTFLMDLFFETLDIKKKKRVHFHRMMSEVHARLQKFKNIEDPIIKIVKSMAKDTRVLCFDEFFVRDIGDAMILGKLLDGFFMHGITLITTSNISPSELYKDGLQREQFLPAIKLLEQNTDIIQIKDGPDYRLRLLENAGTFFLAKHEGTQQKIEQYCSKMAINSNQNNKTLEILGRQIQTICLGQGIVWFAFKDICQNPRGTLDYIEIARQFQTVIISDLPIFTEDKDNLARRFISLVDEFYDHKVNLILSAEENIENIYKGIKLHSEFKRTASRLIEMQSLEYLGLAHLS